MNHVESNGERAARIRVLVVDDDRNAAETMAAILESEVDVTTCTSPALALKSLSNTHFDVVCSDYSMPGMNGVELLGRVSTQTPNAGCLLITGAAQSLEREANALYYVLLKPYDPERLIRLVRQLGKVAQMRRSVGAMRQRGNGEAS